MASQELIDYAKANLASGMEEDAIRAELRARGFANDEIDSAIQSAKTGVPQDNPASNFHLTKRDIYICIGALLILAMIAVWLTNPNLSGVVAGIIK